MRLLIPSVLLGLAAWFATAERPTWPVPAAADLGPLRVDSAPLRAPREPADTLVVAGLPMRCSQCHALFESRPLEGRPLAQHQHVVLDHGTNDNCLNCHDQDDRNLLRTSAGERVPLADVTPLCAGCHGPTWRDWSLGIHGRTNGSWDADSGEQRRLGCSQCHDPHAPAIRGLPAFPGPNTLRMGPRLEQHGHDERRRNPLHQWRDYMERHEAERAAERRVEEQRQAEARRAAEEVAARLGLMPGSAASEAAPADGAGDGSPRPHEPSDQGDQDG